MTTPKFDPSKPVVAVSGKVFGAEEVVELVRSSLDFSLTSGPETERFQRALARRAGVRHALMVNSGSSANLLAIATLCASGMRDRRLRPGDEVITVALGATYNDRAVGTFGDLATLSFYPARQFTTGEGGAVLMQRASLRRVAESLRDWGRDCWCDTGCDNTCGKRFSQQHGTLPPGYDQNYVHA